MDSENAKHRDALWQYNQQEWKTDLVISRNSCIVQLETLKHLSRFWIRVQSFPTLLRYVYLWEALMLNLMSQGFFLALGQRETRALALALSTSINTRNTSTDDEIFLECNSALTRAYLPYETLADFATTGACVMIRNQTGFQGRHVNK